MDKLVMKKLNRQGLIFAVLHTVILLNLTVDLFELNKFFNL